ncbi:MAG TPA: PAS domain S-box protein [Tahibacter sp.]|uniref:PAS domain S-box protein n=1 Tax=Tahibacter sp. TaxID=2056211 RepID=UPI002BF75E29|nr:PAS domain S-box protein [Tahibacter sp.]HSX62667.1 PAS domain S-box protein [Tahibacter sp.]
MHGEPHIAAAFRYSASLIVLLDAGDGCIVDVSPAVEKALGYSRDELIGKRPIDIGLWRNLDERALLWANLRSQGRLCDQPFEFVARDGRVLRMLSNCEMFDLDGRTRVICIGRDLDEQPHAVAVAADVSSYRSLFLAAAEGIYRSLPAGGLIDVNPAMAQIFGYPSPEAMLREFGHSSREVYVDGEDYERVLEEIRRDGVLSNRRSHVRRRDGTTIWISENLRSVHDPDGRLLFYEGSIVDITRQEAAESALRQSEELYRILVDNCRDGVFLIQRGRIVFINDAMAGMLGYAVAELTGSSYMDLVAPESREAQEQRRASRESGSREVQGYEIFMLCKDGSRRLVQVRADPVVYNGDIASTGTARDITEERAQQQALSEAERKYRQLFSHSVVGLFQTRADGSVVEANAALARLLGYASRGEMLLQLRHFDDLRVDPDARQRIFELLQANGRVDDEEVRLRRQDGRNIWISVNIHIVRDSEGGVRSLEGSVQDITARRDAERALLSSEERYRTLVEHAQIGVYVMRDARYIYVNQRFAALTGYDERELIGMHWTELTTETGRTIVEDRLAARQRGDPVPLEYETLLRRKDGRELRISVSAGPIQLEDGNYFSGTARDVTERHRFESELEHNATHDALTGLPNRVLFERYLVARLHDARIADDFRYAILFLDLDGFKLVNDSLGHATGDRLLVEITARLRAAVPPGSVLARYGGDEFTVLPPVCTVEEAERLAQRLLQAVSEPFAFGGHRIYSGASIGIVTGRAGYETPEQVLRDADTAMYRAKARGKSAYVVFDEAMHQAARERLRLETDLREAVERAEFRVHYQPVVDLRSGNVVGCEALLRWAHPQRGLLYPPQFLGVAEETGLIVAIDWWVLEESCRQLCEWQQRYPAYARLRVNVNVDDRQFAERDVSVGIGRVLARTGLSASSLAIEVTETVFRAGRGHAEAILAEVKRLGVSLVVDDFGTGYSSLDSFASSPFDALKIDRSFVRDMEANRRHRAIVRTISGFAEDLGLSLTAEGVETQAQAELLMAMGCGTAQGFLYAPALAADAMEQVLASGSALKRRA